MPAVEVPPPTPEPLRYRPSEPPWLTKLAARRPDAAYILPFMTFLLLLLLNDALPYSWRGLAIALRGGLTLYVFWLFRRYLPPLGRAHWGIAIIARVLVAVGWIAGQHLLNKAVISGHSLGGRFFIFPGRPDSTHPRELFGPVSDFAWYAQVVLRIMVATIAVPVVEEVFWRGFMLRAFIDWDHFDRVPLGAFTWMSFVGTALISTLEHPDNWGVSIFCWLAYNGLMVWKKSIMLCILTHAVTNLVLFTYVPIRGDWIFW